METITFALVMLLAVVVSGSLVRMSPVPIPIPLVQILPWSLDRLHCRPARRLEPGCFFSPLPSSALVSRWLAYSQGRPASRQRHDPATVARPRGLHGARYRHLHSLDDSCDAARRCICARRGDFTDRSGRDFCDRRAHSDAQAAHAHSGMRRDNQDGKPATIRMRMRRCWGDEGRA
jgi:hypothetical protein